jgi:hypothetical protein
MNLNEQVTVTVWVKEPVTLAPYLVVILHSFVESTIPQGVQQVSVEYFYFTVKTESKAIHIGNW